MTTPRSGQTPGPNALASDPAGKEQYDAHVDRIARGAGVSSFGQGVGRLLGYATQVAIARMFGPAQLGFYALGLTLVQLANILSMFGMDNSVVRYVARYRAEGDDARVRGTVLLVLGATFGIGVALSVAMFAGAGFLAEKVFDKPFLESIFRAFAPALPFFTLMSTALYATQGFQTVKYTAYVQEVLRPLVGLALVGVFYLLGVEILGAVAAYILSMAAGAALALYYLRRLLPAGGGVRAKFEAAEVLGSSGPMMVARITTYASAWGMIWVLGVFVSASEVGIYNAASRTAALSGLVLLAFSGIFSPMISNLHGSNSLGHLDRLYKDVSRWAFTGSLGVFVPTVLLSKDILAVFGTKFVTGWPVMVVIAFGYLFASSVGLTGRMLAMTGHERRLMWSRVVATAASLVAGAAAAPAFGLLGAAVAAAAGLVLVNALTLVSVRRLLGFWPYDRLYLKPFAAGVLAGGGAWLARLALGPPQGLVAVFTIGPLFLVLFAAFTMVLRLSDSDRQFLGSFWAAIRRRTNGARGDA